MRLFQGRKILLLAGLAGTGKTTASGFFRLLNIPVVRMGEVTDRYLRREKLVSDETNENRVRRNLRLKYGSDYYARETLPKVANKLNGSRLVIVEGLRSEEERQTFLKEFGNCRLLYLEVPSGLRKERLLKRKNRPLKLRQIELRENYEKINLGTDRLKKEADYLIENSGTLSDLKEEIKELVKKISHD